MTGQRKILIHDHLTFVSSLVLPERTICAKVKRQTCPAVFSKVVWHFGVASCVPASVPDRSPHRAVMHMKRLVDPISVPIQALSNPSATIKCHRDMT
jgi:hypothetical protein